MIDAGLIACAQRVEHYEMAAYGNARLFAEALGHSKVVVLLDATLDEQQAANERLTVIAAATVVPAAVAVGHEETGGVAGEDAEPAATTAKRPARSHSKATARSSR